MLKNKKKNVYNDFKTFEYGFRVVLNLLLL